MLEGGKFVISFLDLIDGPCGTVLGADKRQANFFKDVYFRETMCCNCHDEDEE